MEIEQFLYDLNDSGDAIVAYKMISTSGASVLLCNLGASVLSLTLPTRDGELRDVAAGRCTKGLIEDRERFDERLWESRVEVNRVVMSLSYECDGVGVMAETIFDFDDDDTFEITYQACLEGDAVFDLTHRLELSLGDDLVANINSSGCDDDIYNIACARAGILSDVAKVTSKRSGDGLEILTTQPAIYFDGAVIEPISSPAKMLRSGDRYIQKSVFRHIIL